MSTVQAPSKLGAVHVRLVYFKSGDAQLIQADPPQRAPVTPADLTRVFHQIELLIDHAFLITASASVDRAVIVGDELGVDPDDVQVRVTPTRGEFDPEQLKRLRRSVKRSVSEVLGRPRYEAVYVTRMRMGSPLDVLLEIPLATWPLLGLGLIALAERGEPDDELVEISSAPTAPE